MALHLNGESNQLGMKAEMNKKGMAQTLQLSSAEKGLPR